MTDLRCLPDEPVAILSLQSHGDRSFLDDRDLATLSGALRDEGFPNDLVEAVVPPEGEDAGGSEAESRLVEALGPAGLERFR